MERHTLTARKREKSTKSALHQMRKSGRVPGVVYGLDREPETIEVDFPALRPHLSKRNHVVDLDLGGAKQPVLIKVVDRDPIRQDVLHVDFLRIDDSRPVLATVPVTTHGIPVGVKTQGGVFSVMKKFVRLKAKVADIPEVFDIDVSELNSGTIFYVRDLAFDKGTLVTPGKTALFGVTTGRKEKEEEKPAAPAAATPAAAPAAKAGDKAAPAGDKGGDKAKK